MPAPLLKTLNTRHGPMLALPGDQFITRCLEVYGEFSPAEWLLLEQIIKPGMTVVEVGSNIGAHTVPMARACAPGRLLAFEPQQRVFQILCANLVQNGVTNVIASPDALGAESGAATIPPLDYAGQHNFGGVSLQNPHAEGQAARIIRLDDLELPALGLLKVDVEGFEVQVITGSASTIRRCRPTLYVENDRPAFQRKLIELIHALDYQLYWHTPPLAGPGNFNGVEKNVLGRNYVSINMLGLPRERATGTDLEPIDPVDPRLPALIDPQRAPVGSRDVGATQANRSA